jgi:hypothetical protein
MAKTKTPPFLSRLSKPGKEFVDRVASGHRDLPFGEFIAKQWKDAITDDDWTRPSFLKLINHLAERFPKLTKEQVTLLLRLRRFEDGLEDAAAARRAVRNDPAELVLGLRTCYRTKFAIRGRWQTGCDMDQLLPMCACGEIELARRVANGRRGASSAIPNPSELINIATVAWLNDDKETQAMTISEIESTSMKYVSPWEQAELKAFCAAHRGDAQAVAGRIGDLLSSIKKLRDKTDISLVINLRAHGLYRLLQATSPKLVEKFDVTQGYPWDPEVHAWCDDYPVSSEAWDFTAISDELHQIVVKGKVPEWLPKHPGFYEIELLEADPSNELLMQVIDGKVSYTEHNPMTIVSACPVVFLYEYDQEIAEQYCQRLNTAGGKAKVTKSRGGQYRPIRSN